MNLFSNDAYSRILSSLGVRSINFNTMPTSQITLGAHHLPQWRDTVEIEGDERFANFLNRYIKETVAREDDPFIKEAWDEYQMRLKLKEI